MEKVQGVWEADGVVGKGADGSVRFDQGDKDSGQRRLRGVAGAFRNDDLYELYIAG